MSLLVDFQRGIYDGLMGSSLDSCYRWSCARRFMQEGKQKKERYSGRRYPWVKEILNSRAPFNWVMKGAQIGLTECGINRCFFEIDYYGNDVMYLMPTDKAAKDFSKTRLKNAIALSKYLKENVTDSESLKQFGTATLYIRGANGDINVKSTPVSRLVLDEVDEMQERQLWLALERLSGHDDKLVWGMSTPKFPQTGIHKLYLKSTQEHFFFPCPHCGKEIELTWPDSFVVHGDSVDDPRAADSFIRCHLPSCHGVLPHEEKEHWLSRAYWRATSFDADEGTRGFSLNQMYSPTVTPKEFAVSYLRGRGDEEARREFHNSKLGLPYVEDGSQVTDEHIDRCVRASAPYGLDSDLPRPGDGSIITLGMDQGGFHHWVAVKWDLGKRSGINGDPSDRALGKVIGLGRILQDNWEDARALMVRYQVRMAVVDFLPDPTSARRFARRFPGYVHLCQYIVGRSPREILVHEDDYGANICKVDKAGWTSKALGRIMTGEISFPVDIPLEFRRQLKNQVRSLKRGNDGNYAAEYVRLSDDHWGQALNYAEIALALLNPDAGGGTIISTPRG